jgi:hypothetical protein
MLRAVHCRAHFETAFGTAEMQRRIIAMVTCPRATHVAVAAEAGFGSGHGKPEKSRRAAARGRGSWERKARPCQALSIVDRVGKTHFAPAIACWVPAWTSRRGRSDERFGSAAERRESRALNNGCGPHEDLRVSRDTRRACRDGGNLSQNHADSTLCVWRRSPSRDQSREVARTCAVRNTAIAPITVRTVSRSVIRRSPAFYPCRPPRAADIRHCHRARKSTGDPCCSRSTHRS